jgi:putative membrane protein
MKNILNIIRHDSGKLTSSVVAIITIMGLCIIPCLYAWFNIFSNWAPYDADATGRILVAVANEDRGSEMMGLKVNVGDKIADSLKANDAIGWRFVDNSEDAVEGVRAGDYYAALIIPEDFSIDVMSFVSGSFKNPQLIYYENEKKNAIAPKITGKA